MESATENTPPMAQLYWAQVRVKWWERQLFNVRAHRGNGDIPGKVNPI